MLFFGEFTAILRNKFFHVLFTAASQGMKIYKIYREEVVSRSFPIKFFGVYFMRDGMFDRAEKIKYNKNAAVKNAAAERRKKGDKTYGAGEHGNRPH